MPAPPPPHSAHSPHYSSARGGQSTRTHHSISPTTVVSYQARGGPYRARHASSLALSPLLTSLLSPPLSPLHSSSLDCLCQLGTQSVRLIMPMDYFRFHSGSLDSKRRAATLSLHTFWVLIELEAFTDHAPRRTAICPTHPEWKHRVTRLGLVANRELECKWNTSHHITHVVSCPPLPPHVLHPD